MFDRVWGFVTGVVVSRLIGLFSGCAFVVWFRYLFIIVCW